MMSRDFTFVLDESLARLKNGESLESCLADYPEHSSQLTPLLLTFLSLQTLKTTQPPSPDAVLSGRQRFLTEAAKLRKAEATVQPGPWSRLQEWFSRLRIPVHQQRLAWATVTAIAALLVFILVGGSAVLASADSLPGDPLYPVKRIAETVQLSLTLDPSSHFELERELHERRQQEIQALVMRGREAEVSFEGVVQSIRPGTLSISGYPPIIVDNRTTIEGNMGVGAVVLVKAQSESNGGLRAVTIKVLVPAPNPTATLIPMPIEIAAPVATATQEATEPPPPTPTATSTVTPTPTRPTPTRTASPTVTLTPSPTPTTSPTATPKPEPKPIRWTGCVEEQISERVWVIGSQKVVITDDTKIDGELAVGHIAEVVTEPDGDHHAHSITILKAELFDFAGIIQEIGTPEWTIGGFKVTVDPKKTRIISPRALRLGDYVRVNANRRCVGPPLANIIELLQTIKWSGTVKQINGDRWIIDGSEVLVNQDTKLIGEPGVDSRVEIVAVIQPNGPPLALSITVVPTRTPTPSPTATYTPTPTPTSTPPPTVIATATPQPSPGTSIPDISQ